MRRFLARLANFFRGEGAEREMAREIRAHLALLEEEFEHRGLPPEEAKLAALRAYGGVEQSKELHREARSFIWLEQTLRDVQYGARGLFRTRAFTAAAAIALALGIGANTAVFSVVNAILLRPLPFDDPDRLAAVFETQKSSRSQVCEADFQDWRERTASFDSMSAFTWWSPNLTGVEEPESLSGLRASGELFETLGIHAAMGRTFGRDAERESARVVVISDSFWRRKFGGDPSLVGKSLRLNGQSFEVIGIMPPGFYFPHREIELWIPMPFRAGARRGELEYQAIGRLKPGVTLQQAEAELVSLMKGIAEEFPLNVNSSAGLMPLHESYAGEGKRSLLTLLGAVTLVLLLACANVANLLLAKGSSREHELLIRSSLGASRGRLIAQLLTESALLGLVGGGLGLLFAVFSRSGLMAMLPSAAAEYFGPVAIDIRVAAYALAISLASGLIFGIAPALRTSRVNLRPQTGASRVTARNLHGTMLAVQTALALILLTGAALMMRSFVNVYRVDPGFSTENVQTARINLQAWRYQPESEFAGFFGKVLERVSAIPGVRGAGAVTNLPLSGEGSGGYISFDDRPAPPPGQTAGAARQIVSPGYFQAMRIPLIEGRTFTEADRAGAPNVAIVDQAMARRFWPGQSPLGRRIKRGTLPAPFPWLTVIGVVGEVKHFSLTGNAGPTVFLPYLQSPSPAMNIVVRGDASPQTLAAHIRAAVRAVDPDQPLAAVRTLDDVRWGSLSPRRMMALWLGIFSAIALVLAAVGVYGVVNYAVAQRTREFGIRVALGAEGRDLLMTAVGRGLAAVGVGIAIGLVGSVGMTRLLRSELYGVGPFDALTFVGSAAVLAVVGVAASYLPARRAMSLDPVAALRRE